MLIWGWSVIDLVWSRSNALILVIRNVPYLGKISVQFISQMQKKKTTFKKFLSTNNREWLYPQRIHHEPLEILIYP